MKLSKLFPFRTSWAKHHDRIYKLFKTGYGLSLGDMFDPRLAKIMKDVDSRYYTAVYLFLKDMFHALDTDTFLGSGYGKYFGMITYEEDPEKDFEADMLHIQVKDENEPEGFTTVSLHVYELIDIDLKQPKNKQFIYKLLCRGTGRWTYPEEYQCAPSYIWGPDATFKNHELLRHTLRERIGGFYL